MVMQNGILGNGWRRFDNVCIKDIPLIFKGAILPASLQALLKADKLATTSFLTALHVEWALLDEETPFSFIVKDEASGETIFQKPLSKKEWGLNPLWERLKAEG